MKAVCVVAMPSVIVGGGVLSQGPEHLFYVLQLDARAVQFSVSM